MIKHLDKQIRKMLPGLQYAIKWKKACYGLPDLGWIIEIVAYDVSVNVVFLGVQTSILSRRLETPTDPAMSS